MKKNGANWDGGDSEGARDEIRLGRMDPDYGVPKALESSSRLSSRKNNGIKMIFKKSFSVQAEFHMTPLTHKDFKAELSSIQIEKLLGLASGGSENEERELILMIT